MPRTGRWLILVFLLALLSGLAVPAAPSPTATPVLAQQPATRLETVKATYDLLMDHFYRVPDPAVLLLAAWQGAAEAMTTAGVTARIPPPPDFPADRDRAWSAFAASYPALVALVPARLSQRDLAFAAAASMADSLEERHTGFLPPAMYQTFIASLSGEHTTTGLGIRLRSRAPWVIIEVAPDGPGEHAGLRPGDTIVAVDGQDVTAFAQAQIMEVLRGPAGAVVQVEIDRLGEGRRAVTVTRGPFSFPDLQAQVLPGGVGYIRLRSFSTFIDIPSARPNVLREMDAALDRFEAAGVTHWVVDLRNNPGGFSFTALEFVGRFLAEGVAQNVTNERGNRGQHTPSGRPFRVQRPMAVIVNGGSASSSEIVASALQEYDRAAIIGERTAGALAGSLLFPLPDGAGLAVAVEQVQTGRRNSVVDGIGVVPDIEVADTRTAADYAAGRDPQLDAAIRAARERPSPPAPVYPFSGQLPEAALRSLLGAYLPSAEEAPPTSQFAAAKILGELALTYPNQYVNNLGPVEDAATMAQAVNSRGWQGSLTRYYGQVPALNGPYLAVTIDLYATAAGAYQALNSNDAPQVQRSAPVPVQLGDGTVAYRGTWVNAGVSTLSFRAGRAVVTVAFASVPGQESFEPVVALARSVQARLATRPIPSIEDAPAR